MLANQTMKLNYLTAVRTTMTAQNMSKRENILRSKNKIITPSEHHSEQDDEVAGDQKINNHADIKVKNNEDTEQYNGVQY